MNIYEYAEYYGEHVEDIRRDMADESPDTVCTECGFEYDGEWTRATRYEPSEPTVDCPRCGS